MPLPPWCEANTLDEYLDRGGDINAAHSESGWTLLHYAAENADLGLMAALVARGADLSAKDRDGWSPLHRAVDYDIDGAIQNDRTPDFVGTRTLIQLGASLNARDNEGLTPRDAAALYGDNAVRLFDEMLSHLND
jgi:ankyrin repeat protein